MFWNITIILEQIGSSQYSFQSFTWSTVPVTLNTDYTQNSKSEKCKMLWQDLHQAINTIKIIIYHT